MKNSTDVKQEDEEDDLAELAYSLRPLARSEFSLKLPDSAIASLERLAAEQGTTAKALVARYIGAGLREDLAALYARQLLDMTASVLSRRLHSEAEVSSILKEIREEAAKYG